jgi:hypothetical protein
MCDNRFADRDTVMRYHWGFGVGHTYAYRQCDPLPEPQAQNVRLFPGSEDVPVDICTFSTKTTSMDGSGNMDRSGQPNSMDGRTTIDICKF